MRVLKLPRMLVLAFALLLVGGQQSALAHMLGHAMGEAAATSQVVVAQHGDDDHGAALTLSHVCTTCLALDTFAAPLPVLPRLAFAGGVAAVPPAPTFSTPAIAPLRRYAARAPPALL